MKNFFIKRKDTILLSILSVIIMWVVWIAAYYSVRNDFVIPSFWDSVKSFFICLGEGEFWLAFCVTFLRTLGSFVISFIFGVSFSVLSALSKIFKGLVRPVIVVLRTLPALAVMLIILVWTNAAIAPMIVTVMMLFPVIYSQAEAAIDGIDGDIIQMAVVYKIPVKERFTKIYLPQITPDLFVQVGADISLGLKVMISAEVLSNTFGSLGGLMQDARFYTDMPRLAALTLAAVFAGLIIDVSFSQFKRVNAKWRESSPL